MKLLDIYAGMKKEIKEIEQELEAAVRSDHELLNETSLHLLKAGGKRIRPIIVLLAGQFGSGTDSKSKLKKVAVALELIHMASLVHDDVIDEAMTRRGKLTVRSKWDNRIAMYTGDYIFAKALETVAELKSPRIHQILSKAIVEMSIGEMEQIRHFFNTEQRVRTYLLRIRRKTALLIAISCQLGAIASAADEELVRRLYSYGYNIGMAFQIRDDILDICGTEEELGKPPGSDIRQGNITLPFIYGLEDPQLRDTMLAKIAAIRDADGQADVEPLLEIVRNSEGMKRAKALSDKYIHKALHALEPCPDVHAKRVLIDIAHFVGSRSY